MDFQQTLENQVLVGDGAMGTYLYDKGVPLEGCFEELNVSRPDLIAAVHTEYLEAGAQLIETNTFGANALRLGRHGLEAEVRRINIAAVQNARTARGTRPAWIAGSMGPTGLSAPQIAERSGEVAKAFETQAESLLEGGVDLLFLETFTLMEEALAALGAIRRVSSTALVNASVSAGESARLRDGSPLDEAFRILRGAGAQMVGINCTSGPALTRNLLQAIPVEQDSLLAVFPNAGRPEYFEGRHYYGTSPEYFAAVCKSFVAEGARIIGGCCGTTPAHIAALSKALTGLQPVFEKTVEKSVIEITTRPSGPAPIPEETILDIIKKRTLIVTELDPPKTLTTEKFITGARALTQAGTDAVTLADNSLAILRVSNLAMATLIREKAGAMPMLHLACRDRNLLGLQSELMGMAALGIHHVLALTGDPPQFGDHPGASAVYDVNSVGLIDLIRRMNEGFNQSGKSIKNPTRFTIGCALNPNAKNFDSQIKKLEQKIRAGAQFVMTQPVYDRAKIRETHERTKDLGIPVLVGVFPLINGRNAEFLHNEVPGIVIPDAIRERMRGKEEAAGAAEGLAIAREITEEVLALFKGIYLITPLLRYETTVELSQWVRAQERRA
ncbi:MAG: bifunctional homocysteine S-methyltransferase/methylenetetrahydrofolate reductase [Verrucomicrobiae bacterium]|nr:bifunctional homocysteine S-methyltransferase/methylenetetrahydrofolate reductase [Verrucomicrobiae bacterium]